MSESGITKQTLLALSQLDGVRVWRQNVAKLPDLTGQWIQFGIPGMADVGGIAAPGGWRLEIELKKGKGHRNRKVIERQKRWRAMIERHGGIYLLARNAQDAVEQLKAVLAERRKDRTSESSTEARNARH